MFYEDDSSGDMQNKQAQASNSDPNDTKHEASDGSPDQPPDSENPNSQDDASNQGDPLADASEEQPLFGPSVRLGLFNDMVGAPHSSDLFEWDATEQNMMPLPENGLHSPPFASMEFEPSPFGHHQPTPHTDYDIEQEPGPEPPPFGITDPLFPKQWQLHNTSCKGVDLNVVETWEDYTGNGIIIGVIDDGVDFTHPDLSANYLPAYGYDAEFGTNDPSPKTSSDNHGTNCVSLAAAARNGLGIVGVAYDAHYSVSRISFGTGPSFEAMTADAVNHTAYADVVSMSFGDTAFTATPLSIAAYENLAENGRGGLGSVMLHAIGNARDFGEMGGYEKMSALPSIIGVAAINETGRYSWYSTPSASTLITAPGDHVWMADREAPNGYNPSDAYTEGSGTSYSTPLAAGVAALILEANPSLGYRDVQSILAMTARMTDNAASDPDMPWDWQINGAETWNNGGMHASHDYGYGLVDSLGAVRLAESWDQEAHGVANEDILSQTEAPAAVIPDGGHHASTVTIGSSITIDYAVVELTVTGGYPSQLTVTLDSPFGTTSWLMNNPPAEWDADFTHTFNESDTHPFGTTQCRGEEGMGNWTLTVNDTETGVTHTLNSWTLTLHGDTPDNNDLYVFTNEFSDMSADDGTRSLLADTGGIDTMNASAVSTASLIDLRDGGHSIIDSTPLNLDAGTVIENAHGGDGNDTIFGNDADNQLFGWRGNDSLFGGAGADSITGGIGSDILSGGTGSDLFQYTSTDHGHDRITDFSHADDIFTFAYAEFGQSGTGNLDADHFFTSTSDVDVHDSCFIFEADMLWYDSDGTGSEAAVDITEVSGDDIQLDDIVFV